MTDAGPSYRYNRAWQGCAHIQMYRVVRRCCSSCPVPTPQLDQLISRCSDEGTGRAANACTRDYLIILIVKKPIKHQSDRYLICIILRYNIDHTRITAAHSAPPTTARARLWITKEATVITPPTRRPCQAPALSKPQALSLKQKDAGNLPNPGKMALSLKQLDAGTPPTTPTPRCTKEVSISHYIEGCWKSLHSRKSKTEGNLLPSRLGRTPAA